jgi:DNA-binding transcriptional regulator YhcF (GntR family)
MTLIPAHPGRIVLSAKERAALVCLAHGESRIAYRAKGVLLLADGLSKAAVARKLRVGESAVRQWERRWLAGGGTDSLRRRGRKRAPEQDGEAAVPDLPTRIPATELALLRREPTGRGRPVSARIAIEAWVRDAAALGLVAPGARLPDQMWFVKCFRAASHTVADAFSALAKQGFVRNRRRIGSFVASPLPFDKRYLLLLTQNDEGLDLALASAAREQEGRLGVQWDVVRGGHSRDILGLSDFQRDVASQRWAGVFLRTSPSTDLPGWEFLHLDRTPVSGDLYDLPFHGKHVVPLENAWHGSGKWKRHFTETVFRTIRDAGGRRVLVFDNVGDDSPGGREEAMGTTAASFGLALPESCYQLLAARQKEQIATILSAVLRVARLERIDAVAVLQDNFAAPVCDALVARFGAEAASRLFIAAIGNRPALPRCALPVAWHGHDYSVTLDSFVEWCDAIHAGEKTPPAPVLAMF